MSDDAIGRKKVDQKGLEQDLTNIGRSGGRKVQLDILKCHTHPEEGGVSSTANHKCKTSKARMVSMHE